ncbi:methyltransferase domain-containing protein [Shewanella livingstonensis]|uniref:Methyltransferase domain-containing protein n=1 Tax=Shewanella livingstonensis TaxID=150120 RepID=A0A3G8LYI3_9GAMM|nr:methyltransferase domain-containing protein [Shewanella livingstonensis]AZG73758.1 methyltransferase domain-containing protein [Shewanella livingstonensis]
MTLDNPVANKFSLAAAQYKQHDVLQRISAQQLLQQANLTGTLLDVGAGPGTDFSVFDKVKQVVAVDIAHGMLAQLAQQHPNYLPLCCDAQALGLLSHSIDSIYSNLALQWCQTLPKAFAEFHRVLRVGGECHLSVVIDGSLAELQTLGFHVNQFDTLSTLKAAFNASPITVGGWHNVDIQVETINVYFADLRSLLYSIKGVGASFDQQSDGTKRQPLTKLQWRQRVTLAETLRTDKGLPLTYQIAYIRAKRG